MAKERLIYIVLVLTWCALLFSVGTFAYADTLAEYQTGTNDRWGDLLPAKQTVDCGDGWSVTEVALKGYGTPAPDALISFNGSASTSVTFGTYPTSAWATSTFDAVECIGTGTIWVSSVGGDYTYLVGNSAGTYTGGSFLSLYHNSGNDDVYFKVIGTVLEPVPVQVDYATLTQAIEENTEAVYSVGMVIVYAIGIAFFLFFFFGLFRFTRNFLI